MDRRSEQAMYALILAIARGDERIRAVILNGSRANPQAPRDDWQDFDIVYLVTEVESFRRDLAWFDRFGELTIRQFPDGLFAAEAAPAERLACLMQFEDGNRIDLTLRRVADQLGQPLDSLSVLLLDKDGRLPLFPPPSEADYLPRPPAASAYAAGCNEFWWVCPYVAKGLRRRQIVYALAMFEQVVRPQLTQMLTWHIGWRTNWARNPGKFGQYFEMYLEPAEWKALQATYSPAEYERAWQALEAAGDLFSQTAQPLAQRLGFEYPAADDRRVRAYLQRLRPKGC